MNKRSQSGFSVIELILGFVAVTAIGAAIYFAVQANTSVSLPSPRQPSCLKPPRLPQVQHPL